MRVQREFPRTSQVEDVSIPLGDGCRIAARIFRPKDAEERPVPAVFEYIPYGKRDDSARRDAIAGPYLAGHGYALVRADLRGSGESEGRLTDEYLEEEHDDAVELIQWIAQQPWCSGQVAMMGISWGGFNGLQVAARQPEPLGAVISVASTDDRYEDDIHYQGGALLSDNLSWAAMMLRFQTRPPDPALVGERWRAMWLDRLDSAPFLAPIWMAHPRRDAYWQHGSICEDFDAVKAPVLSIAGWSDAYSNAVPRIVEGLADRGKGIIGPWVHAYPHIAVPGPRIGFLQEALRFLDQQLQGKATGAASDPRYRIFVQQSMRPEAEYSVWPGRWVAEPGWPPPQTEWRALYLNEDHLEPAAGRETACQVRSPETTGLACGRFMPMWLGPSSPTDQREDDAGSLVFDTPPLEEPLEVLGEPVLELELAVDRPVAHVTARLCDVFPEGASSRVSFRTLNLTHRDGHDVPELLEPGRRYRVRLPLKDCAHRFLRGQRLRIALSTAYWPMVWPAPEPVTLTVFTGASRLLLPVRPSREEAPVEFPEPEGAAPLDYEWLRRNHHERHVVRDVGHGRVKMTLVDDMGHFRINEHGLEVDAVLREDYQIVEDDPTSARMDTHWSHRVARGEWQVRIESYTWMTSDRESFHVGASLKAYEGNTLVRERSWSETIPRDHV